MHNAFLLLRSPTETISSLWTWHQLKTHNVLRQLLTGQTLALGRADFGRSFPKSYSRSLLSCELLLYRIALFHRRPLALLLDLNADLHAMLRDNIENT